MINFEITQTACDKLKSMLEIESANQQSANQQILQNTQSNQSLSQPQYHNLRVAIKGGGCAGFEYDFEIDENIESGDFVFEKDGIKVLIDPISAWQCFNN